MTPEEQASKIVVFYLNQRSFRQQDIEREIATAIRDAVEEVRSEARTALEPFARLAARFDNVNNPWLTWRDDNWLPWDAPLDRKFFTIGQLRAARDAYRALGGKIE